VEAAESSMKKLELPSVSLVMMDTTCPELAKLAVEDSLRGIEFGDVIIFSDTDLKVGGARWVEVAPWLEHEDYNKFFWYRVPKYLTTDFAIFIQWDSWIINTLCWTNEFLKYDYVGAPWWYEDNWNVGNGCGLRSTRLMQFLEKRRGTFPLFLKEEDHLICRMYRAQLESHGFKWAPNHLATQFAFECTRPAPDSQHLMFHDSLNFPLVLQGDRLEIRVRLMNENPYLQKGEKLELYRKGRQPLIMPWLAHPGTNEISVHS
jgi:hypothetical protein